MKGKLIVIEGADASGKQTQSELLIKSLKKEGFRAELISFPRYKTEFGKLVRKYLSGAFGPIKKVSPEFASLLYALDRYDAAASLQKKLEQGNIVVCDRYTASNIAHQAAKFSGAKQYHFIKWVNSVESELPIPNITIYLDVPLNVSQILMKKQGRKRDLHEQNLSYLKKVRLVYLKLAKKKNWVKINCVQGKKLRSIATIHSDLREVISGILK
tara:strand:+ start:1763 stop:2404 length:642 start_codon:yes stop_codon:yes gene_type:complete